MAASLFSPGTLGGVSVPNRIVMAPMTRSRAVTDNAPNAMVAEFYAMRADAALLITEGTAPCADGVGYARIPGVYSDVQVEGWRTVAEAVHARGGRLFVQLMHCGRVFHQANAPEGARCVSASATQLTGDMWTDTQGMQPHTPAEALTADGLASTRDAFVQAAKNAIAAGADGVELHGANGYLLEQFLAPCTNFRTDEYGGAPENRNRFVLEVAAAVVDAIGAHRVGIRLSPFGVFNGITPWDGLEEQYVALASELSKLGLAYLHLLDHSPMGAPPVPASTMKAVATAFGGTIIRCGGFGRETGDAAIAEGTADFVAFGRPYLANPDLVTRLATGAPQNAPRFDLFYTPGAEGYTDYPTL